MNCNDVLKHDEGFRYRLLSRMKSDCKYYLGNGNRYAGHLWAKDEFEQIAYMKALWNSFGENDKPEWLTFEQILEYEKQIGIPAILVEMDYKGYYERFALTPEEFEKTFPETYKSFGPIEEGNSDTLKPLVHIWFEPCIVGDASWEDFFTDMEQGLPESDIASGNLAYIDYRQMQSLIKYLEDTIVYHCRGVFQHDNLPFAEDEIKLQVMSAVKSPDYTLVNLECVEENKVEVGDEYPDDYIFTFEFDVKVPRDSQICITDILKNVNGGEVLNQYYERSKRCISLEEKINEAKREENERVLDDKSTILNRER